MFTWGRQPPIFGEDPSQKEILDKKQYGVLMGVVSQKYRNYNYFKSTKGFILKMIEQFRNHIEDQPHLRSIIFSIYLHTPEVRLRNLKISIDKLKDPQNRQIGKQVLKALKKDPDLLSTGYISKQNRNQNNEEDNIEDIDQILQSLRFKEDTQSFNLKLENICNLQRKYSLRKIYGMILRPQLQFEFLEKFQNCIGQISSKVHYIIGDLEGLSAQDMFQIIREWISSRIESQQKATELEGHMIEFFSNFLKKLMEKYSLTESFIIDILENREQIGQIIQKIIDYYLEKIQQLKKQLHGVKLEQVQGNREEEKKILESFRKQKAQLLQKIDLQTKQLGRVSEESSHWKTLSQKQTISLQKVQNEKKQLQVTIQNQTKSITSLQSQKESLKKNNEELLKQIFQVNTKSQQIQLQNDSLKIQLTQANEIAQKWQQICRLKDLQINQLNLSFEDKLKQRQRFVCQKILQQKNDQIAQIKEKLGLSKINNHAIQQKLQEFLLKNQRRLTNLFIEPSRILDEKESQLLYQRLETLGKIKQAKLLYKHDPKNKANFHDYIDGKEKILIIAKTNHKIVGAFSQEPLVNPLPPPTGSGFLFTIKEVLQVYPLMEGKHALYYNKNLIIIGKSQIRIDQGKLELHSNFALKGHCFETRGHKINDFLGEGDMKRTIQLQNYEIYQIVYEHQSEEQLLKKQELKLTDIQKKKIYKFQEDIDQREQLKLEDQVRTLEKELDRKRQEIDSLIQQLKDQLTQIQKLKENSIEQIKDLENKLNENSESTKKLKDQIVNLKNQIRSKQEEMVRLSDLLNKKQSPQQLQAKNLLQYKGQDQNMRLIQLKQRQKYNQNKEREEKLSSQIVVIRTRLQQAQIQNGRLKGQLKKIKLQQLINFGPQDHSYNQICQSETFQECYQLFRQKIKQLIQLCNQEDYRNQIIRQKVGFPTKVQTIMSVQQNHFSITLLHQASTKLDEIKQNILEIQGLLAKSNQSILKELPSHPFNRISRILTQDNSNCLSQKLLSFGKMKEVKLLYRLNPNQKWNFHEEDERNSNVLLIVKTAKKIIGGFCIRDHISKSQKNILSFLFGLKEGIIETYSLIQGKRNLFYDEKSLIFGISELRVDQGSLQLISNFGMKNRSFDSRSHSVNHFLEEGEMIKSTQIKDYEIIQIVFECEKTYTVSQN